MATHASLSMASVSIDTTELKDLAKILGRADNEVKKQLYRDLRVAGVEVAEEAKRLAFWSTRIPGAIVVRGSGLHVRVVAQGSKAPNAAPLENKGQGGRFRHPVFGHMDVWVSQSARPFLSPALEARAGRVVEIVMQGVDMALVAAGFDQ